MKFLRLILIIFTFILLYLKTHAQSSDEGLMYQESVLAMEKKAIILKYFHLTEGEKAAFWPLYNRYNREIHDYEMEYFRLLARYTKGIDNLPERTLKELSERFVENDLEMARIRKQYMRRFKHALSTAKATEFMVLDNTFRHMVRLEIQNSTAPMDVLTRGIYHTSTRN